MTFPLSVSDKIGAFLDGSNLKAFASASADTHVRCSPRIKQLDRERDYQADENYVREVLSQGNSEWERIRILSRNVKSMCGRSVVLIGECSKAIRTYVSVKKLFESVFSGTHYMHKNYLATALESFVSIEHVPYSNEIKIDPHFDFSNPYGVEILEEMVRSLEKLKSLHEEEYRKYFYQGDILIEYVILPSLCKRLELAVGLVTTTDLVKSVSRCFALTRNERSLQRYTGPISESLLKKFLRRPDYVKKIDSEDLLIISSHLNIEAFSLAKEGDFEGAFQLVEAIQGQQAVYSAVLIGYLKIEEAGRFFALALQKSTGEDRKMALLAIHAFVSAKKTHPGRRLDLIHLTYPYLSRETSFIPRFFKAKVILAPNLAEEAIRKAFSIILELPTYTVVGSQEHVKRTLVVPICELIEEGVVSDLRFIATAIEISTREEDNWQSIKALKFLIEKEGSAGSSFSYLYQEAKTILLKLAQKRNHLQSIENALLFLLRVELDPELTEHLKSCRGGPGYWKAIVEIASIYPDKAGEIFEKAGKGRGLLLEGILEFARRNLNAPSLLPVLEYAKEQVSTLQPEVLRQKIRLALAKVSARIDVALSVRILDEYRQEVLEGGYMFDSWSRHFELLATYCSLTTLSAVHSFGSAEIMERVTEFSRSLHDKMSKTQENLQRESIHIQSTCRMAMCTLLKLKIDHQGDVATCNRLELCYQYFQSIGAAFEPENFDYERHLDPEIAIDSVREFEKTLSERKLGVPISLVSMGIEKIVFE